MEEIDDKMVQKVYLAEVSALDHDVGTIVLAQLHFHYGGDDGHDDGDGYSQILAMEAECQCVIPSRSADNSLLLLLLRRTRHYAIITLQISNQGRATSIGPVGTIRAIFRVGIYVIKRATMISKWDKPPSA